MGCGCGVLPDMAVSVTTSTPVADEEVDSIRRCRQSEPSPRDVGLHHIRCPHGAGSVGPFVVFGCRARDITS